jgi:dihydropteroate synthase
VIVVPVSGHSARSLSDTLRAQGWEPGLAASTAAAAAGAAFHVQDVDAEVLLALVRHAGSLGLDVVTGDDWALLSGSRARLSALARPWTVPALLAPLAEAVGLAMAPEPPARWRVRGRDLDLAAPLVMGILNVTPDSFSDAGQVPTIEAAVARARELVAQGADLVDIGGESTRPGRTALVPADEEARRVVPVIAALREAMPDAVLSVDTMKASVARDALAAGAHLINDVTGLRHDAAMASVVRDAGAGLVLMHSRGEPLALASAEGVHFEDVVAEVLAELASALGRAMDAGVPADCIVVDPGFGFGKLEAHNLRLADQLDALLALGRPVLVGPSRKRFLGAVTGRSVDRRDVATAACCALCYERGARIFRVHHPAATRDALAVAHAIASR